MKRTCADGLWVSFSEVWIWIVAGFGCVIFLWGMGDRFQYVPQLLSGVPKWLLRWCKVIPRGVQNQPGGVQHLPRRDTKSALGCPHFLKTRGFGLMWALLNNKGDNSLVRIDRICVFSYSFCGWRCDWRDFFTKYRNLTLICFDTLSKLAPSF